MPRRKFDYHQFLLKFKLYFVETVATVVFVVYVLHAIARELHPLIIDLWHVIQPALVEVARTIHAP